LPRNPAEREATIAIGFLRRDTAPERQVGNAAAPGGKSDPIRESLAKALGHPLPNVVYAGGENRFRPLVEGFRQELAAEPGTAAGCDFLFNALYLLLERLAPIEPLLQAPCGRETAVLEAIHRESQAVSYGRMLQFYVTRALSVLHYGTVLSPSPSIDVGCGDGFTPLLVFTDKTIDVGSDLFVHDLVDAARRRAPFRRLEVGDIQNLPYADDSFATVFSMNTVYHAPDKLAAVRELGRIVAPGGTVHFDYFLPAFADQLPLAKLLEAGGFGVSADELRRSMFKPQVEFTPELLAELLPGFAIELVPAISAPLMNLIMIFHGLDVTLPWHEPTPQRREHTLRLLRSVIAPLLAQDRELSGRGGNGYMYVHARKPGHASPAIRHRCPNCGSSVNDLTCASCGSQYRLVEGVPLLATQYSEALDELAHLPKATAPEQRSHWPWRLKRARRTPERRQGGQGRGE
jgi:SAM-dependent methyltransferase